MFWEVPAETQLLLSLDILPPVHLGAILHLMLIISTKMRVVCWWWLWSFWFFFPPLYFPLILSWLRFVFLLVIQVLNKFICCLWAKGNLTQPKTSSDLKNVGSLVKFASTPRTLNRALPFGCEHVPSTSPGAKRTPQNRSHSFFRKSYAQSKWKDGRLYQRRV